MGWLLFTVGRCFGAIGLRVSHWMDRFVDGVDGVTEPWTTSSR
jgi:hypothetical protein